MLQELGRNNIGITLFVMNVIYYDMICPKKNIRVEFECESGWILWFSSMESLSDVIDIIICLIKFMAEWYNGFYSFIVLYCSHEMAWEQYHWTYFKSFTNTHLYICARMHAHMPWHYIILFFGLIGVLPGANVLLYGFVLSSTECYLVGMERRMP